MIYFLLDNKSLSAFSESPSNQSLSLVAKAKLDFPIFGIINNSRKLNSVISRALDKICEKISLTNNVASVIIDDSLLSHSIIVGSKKYDDIEQQIKEESKLKWGEKIGSYYLITEEKKTPKNIFHSVAINHFLREKIKLNFNNFGLSIRYLVPLSSILTASLKPSQFSVIKNGKKYQFFGNTRKGFMFFKLNFSGSKKVEEKVIGLLDIPNIKSSDLKKNNLKFIFFNSIKIVEYLANYIFKEVPLLNFAEASNSQISAGKFKIKTPSYHPLNKGFEYNNLIKNLSSGFLSLLFLLFILSLISNYDFLNFEDSQTTNSKLEINEKVIKDKFVPKSSSIMIENLLSIEKRFLEVNNFLLTENEFIVNDNKVELEKSSLNLNLNYKEVSFNELLISLFKIENNLKFKVFEFEKDGNSFLNVVLKFSDFENFSNSLSEIKKFGNIDFKKASLENNSDSIHLYLSILKL